MADGTTLSTNVGTGDKIATDDLGATGKAQWVKLMDGTDGGTDTIPGTAATGLRVDPASVSVADGGTLPAKGVQVGGTDGTVFQVLSTDSAGRLNTNVNGTVPVSGPLTDAQLRATAVPVSGTVTASGPLTDAQLRATPVPISGTVTANGAVTNAGTFAVQDSQKIADNAAFVDGTTPVQPVGYVFDEVAGTALTENDAAAARIDSKRAQVTTLEDATTRGQRAAVSAGGALKVDNSAVTQPVSAASLPLPAGASTAVKQPALGTAGAASADVITVQGVASMTPLLVNGSGVTQPVSGTVTATGPLTDAQLRATPVPVSGTVTANAGTGPFPVSDNAGSLTVDAPVGTPAFVRLSDGAAAITTLATSLASLPALATGSNLAGRVNLEPQTANGLSIFHLVSAGSTNATNVKASAGQVYGWYIYNSNAAARKVVFHNTAGTPTAGAGVIFALMIPPTSAANVEMTNGLAFATGIAITTVTDLTDAGTTVVAANDLVINVFYK